MGQYYKPVSLEKEEFICAHDIKSRHQTYDGKSTFMCGEGLKLMEHSYIGNKLMTAVENLLMPNGAWHNTRIVWAGDYADPEFGTVTKEKENGHNIYDLVGEHGKKLKRSDLSLKKRPKKFRYLCNHDTEEYVDLDAVQEFEEDWRIHPLSLLTCDGNGRGGGDFRGEDRRIGIWRRNRISIEDHIPLDFQEEPYKEIDGTFSESNTVKCYAVDCPIRGTITIGSKTMEMEDKEKGISFWLPVFVRKSKAEAYAKEQGELYQVQEVEVRN